MKQLLPLAALALTACATTAIPSSSAGLLVRSNGVAGLGQPTRVGSLVVTPEALVEDSRCPMNARCVWAGRLVLKTRLDGVGWHETVNLTLGQPYVTHGSGVTLVSVKPDRMAGAAVLPNDYRFDFMVAPTDTPNTRVQRFLALK